MSVADYMQDIKDFEDGLLGRPVSNGLNVLQNGMLKLGLRTPAERGVALAAGSLGLLYAVQPKFAFDNNGVRPFSLTSPSQSSTVFHPLAIAAALGAAGALFL